MRARTKLAIPSVIALLVIALSPGVAHGETASEKVYHVTPGSIESYGPKELPDATPPHRTDPSQRKRAHDDQAVDESDKDAKTRPDEAEPDNTQTRGDEHSEDGARNEQPTTSTKHSIADRRPVSDVGPAAFGSSGNQDGSDDGDASPILFVLIAVAALAVLSVGVAFYNQRSRPGRH